MNSEITIRISLDYEKDLSPMLCEVCNDLETPATSIITRTMWINALGKSVSWFLCKPHYDLILQELRS